MSYLVFARKFRPQTFDEVIGQEPITTTLKNAISKNRIAQSFLFTGSRGVGKTSTARIFAKALNCEKGPTADPCNKCSICQEITQCSSLDVLEIDGASNRGVDEIRNLRDNVKFKPARTRFKIYIIDEVHMLTGEAFNALLKTLEEPPEHVRFIFATTEVHKLPLTILSRCQRFNFRRIPIEDLITKLKEIAKKEKIKVQDKALFLIAKSSEGSLRDGESLLDQLASFGEGEIKETDVTFSLGLTDEDLFFSILESIKNKDSKAVLSAVQKISEEGKDLTQFVKGLLELFRDLLVLKAGEQTENLVEVTEEALKNLKKLKEAFSKEELLFALTLIQQLMREIRWSETPRFLIETCLLKIAHRADLRSIDELLSEIKNLNFEVSKKKEEIRLTPSISSSNSEITSVLAATRPVSRHDSEETTKTAVIVRRPVGTAKTGIYGSPTLSEKNVKFFPKSAPRIGASVKAFGDDTDTSSQIASAMPLNPTDSRTEQSRNRSSFGAATPQDDRQIAGPLLRNDSDTAFSFDDVCRVWPDLVDQIKSVKMSCGTFLAEALPVEVVDGFAVFGFPAHLKFHKESLEQQAHKDLIKSTLSALVGTQVNVSFIIKDGEPNTALPINKKPAVVAQTEVHNEKESDIVSSALNIFGGSKVIHRDTN